MSTSNNSRHSAYPVPNQNQNQKQQNDFSDEEEQSDEERVSIDSKTQEAIDWFNNLKKRTKYDLILNQYELQMSLKDIKTEKLKEAIDKKWLNDINNLKNIIKEKEINIKELRIENEALITTSQKGNGVLINKINENQAVYIKEISQLEQKLLKNNAQLEQLIVRASQSSETIQNSQNVQNVQNDYPEDVELILNTVPNCSISRQTQEIIYIESSGILGIISKRMIDKVTIDKIKGFKGYINNAQENIEFAIFISKTAIHGRTFHLDFESTKKGNVFLFYITDPFSNPDRLITVINLITTLSNNIKYTENLNNVLFNINNIMDKIENLILINKKMKSALDSHYEIIIENEECIENLRNAIRETVKADESDVDKRKKICIDIVKYYILNNRTCTLKNVIAKAELFGLKSSQANTIITRQLGGLKEIRTIAKRLIESGEPCSLKFNFSDKIEDDIINAKLEELQKNENEYESDNGSE